VSNLTPKHHTDSWYIVFCGARGLHGWQWMSLHQPFKFVRSEDRLFIQNQRPKSWK